MGSMSWLQHDPGSGFDEAIEGTHVELVVFEFFGLFLV
jgi:hypothetical protein